MASQNQPQPNPQQAVAVEQSQTDHYLARKNAEESYQYNEALGMWNTEKTAHDQRQLRDYGANAQPFPKPQPQQPVNRTHVTAEDDICLAMRNEIHHLMCFDWQKTRRKCVHILIFPSTHLALVSEKGFRTFSKLRETGVNYTINLTATLHNWCDTCDVLLLPNFLQDYLTVLLHVITVYFCSWRSSFLVGR